MTTSVFNIGSRRRGRRRRKRSRSCRVVVAEQKAEQEDEEQEVSIPAAVEDVSFRVMIADSEHRVVTIARASMIDLMNCTKASMPRFATLEVIVLLAAPLSLFLPRLLLLMRLCCVGVCVCGFHYTGYRCFYHSWYRVAASTNSKSNLTTGNYIINHTMGSL